MTRFGPDGPPMVAHVGMMKAASSTLQLLWRRSPAIDLIHADVTPWMNAFRSLDRSRQIAQFGEIVARNVSGERPVVVTHESLGGLGRVDLVRCLKRFFPAPQMLYVTRNPWDYTVSLYHKNLRNGYAGTLQDFVAERRDGLRRTFDLDGMIRDCRDRLGVPVHFVPFELLKSDLARFIALVNAPLGCAAIAEDALAARNQTPPLQALAGLAVLNRLAERLMSPQAKAEFNRVLYDGTRNLHETATGGWVAGLEGLVPDDFEHLGSQGAQAQARGALRALCGGMEILRATPAYASCLDRYLAF